VIAVLDAGAVSRTSSSNASGSPSENSAADGTGITQAALSELALTLKAITMSSAVPSHAMRARSVDTDAPARFGRYAPQPHAHAGAARLDAKEEVTNIITTQTRRTTRPSLLPLTVAGSDFPDVPDANTLMVGVRWRPRTQKSASTRWAGVA
jgi:hypothetical protein